MNSNNNSMNHDYLCGKSMNEDIGLPKATIMNLIKDYLPAETRISNEANEVILAMASEFVNHLSSISNDICLEGGKKTISQSHVAEAMKKLKQHEYLAKIMNVEDSKELEGMTEKKKKEMLNSSLNVTRKKKKGLTKEEEEELRKKQALLFSQDQNIEMLPSELQRHYSTPTSQPQGVPYLSHVQPNFQPNDAKFYDGSITQVLQNPTAQAAQNAVDNGSNAYPNADQTQNGADGEKARKEEQDEEVVSTSKQPDTNATADAPPSAAQMTHEVSVTDVAKTSTQVDEAQKAHNQAMLAHYERELDLQRKRKKTSEEEEDFE
jgi:histone H3/H4/flavin-binding protein dodecin